MSVAFELARYLGQDVSGVVQCFLYLRDQRKHERVMDQFLRSVDTWPHEEPFSFRQAMKQLWTWSTCGRHVDKLGPLHKYGLHHNDRYPSPIQTLRESKFTSDWRTWNRNHCHYSCMMRHFRRVAQDSHFRTVWRVVDNSKARNAMEIYARIRSFLDRGHPPIHRYKVPAADDIEGLRRYERRSGVAPLSGQ